MRCLVTGATGYIGGRPAPPLLAEGHQVRCPARHANRLRDVPRAGQVDIVEGDLRRPETLPATFAASARAASGRRIVSLGGPIPADDGGPGSAHLRSRAEVGRTLLDSGVPTAVL